MPAEPQILPITSWPAGERPRERLLHSGPQSLTDAELLALILHTGMRGWTALDLARQVLVRDGGLSRLGSRTTAELMRVKGIGCAKAVRIAAAFEIGRRVQARPTLAKIVVRGPEDVARYMIPRLRDRVCEVFHVLALDAMNGVKQDVELSRGTLNASLVHPREVFKAAIDAAAAAIVVVHNHPSGNPEPSQEDVEITRQLRDAGRVVGIPLHDHIIVAGDSFTSLASRGEL